GPRPAAENAEGTTVGAGGYPAAGVDPGRLRVEDGDAREHVPLVDPPTERGPRRRQLDARVHAFDDSRVRRLVDPHRVAVLDEEAHGIRQVQLTLRVPRLKPIEGGPELRGLKNVDRGVHLVDRELLGRRVGRLDDRFEPAVAAPDDATVRT